MMLRLALDFDDVFIVPKYSDIISRKFVDTKSETQKLSLRLPVISSNMKTITEAKMCIAMSEHGAMGAIHRFMGADQIKQQIEKLRPHPLNDGTGFSVQGDISFPFAVSIGVQTDDKFLFDQLFNNGARIFCIDVAHGHHILVKNMLGWIRNKQLDDITIIAGNVATPGGAKFLIDEGADIVKVGIGGSKVCRTRGNTGIGMPTLQSLIDIRESLPKCVMIADGGIKQVGDIAKALVFANFVMLGTMLAGTSETPGKVFKDRNGEYYKVYQGSASGENKGTNNMETKFVEGVTEMVPFRGKAKYILREIDEGLRSSFSYVGAKNLEEFHQKAELIQVTNSTKIK